MHLELPTGVVDIWRVDLDADADGPPVLSREESARADRFRDPRDGERWRRARTALRRLLADYLDMDPRELVIEAASRGKPFLGTPASDLRFSVSHAATAALLAFTRGTEVGVDFELRSRRIDALALARQAFGEANARALGDLPADRREEAFLRAWVRHEATVKCVGTGLGGSTPDAADVWLTDLDVSPDVVAALATTTGPCTIRCREYSVAAQSR